MADEDEIAELYLTWKLETLMELRPFLVSKLEPQKLYTYLRSVEAIDEDDQEEIQAEKTRKRKAELLLDIIGKRGSEGFDSFCESVCQNKTQLFILREILKCFQQKKERYYGDISPQLENDRQRQNINLNCLPIPGQLGGPVIPAFERPGDNIAAVQEPQGRSQSPPPAYYDVFQ